MTRLLVPCVLALCLAGEAHAQSVAPYLKWNDCSGEGGALAMNFDCNTNVGNERLVASFATTGVTQPIIGVDAIIAIAGQDFLGIADPFGGPPLVFTPLGSWWDMRPGTPRGAALSVSADFTGLPFSAATHCADYWTGQATGARNYMYPVAGNPGLARLQAVFAVPEGTVTPVPEDGREYYVFSVTLGHLKTVGVGAADGCCTKVVAQIETLRLYFADGTDLGAQGGGYYDVSVSRQHESVACAPVPARNATWGAVKSLYR